VVTDGAIQNKKRPRWVWAISIFFFLSAGWTLLSFYLISTGAIPLNAVQKEYYDRLAGVDYAVSIIMGLANLVGAVALLLLRKIAFYLFAVALGANLILAAWHTATKGWMAAVGGAGFVGVVIGWVLLIAVCIYSWRLVQRGVLT
jgi:hypothetical protein